MARVGVIGLGTMGAPMARRLLKGGHSVVVFARRAESMAPLLDAGAQGATSPAEAASKSDVTITMVLDTRAVEEVILGPRGVVEGAQRGSVVVDHSTIEPDGARRIAAALEARGVHMLDAPVSGGSTVTEAGKLSIMAGGDEAVLDRVRPILECYGQTIVHIGPSGAGQVAKACNQICTIVNTLGTAEAMLMAERAGVDPNRVKEVLMTGFGASRMLEVQAPKMIARNFEGKVESRLHYKDIHIVLDMARSLGIELPASSAAAAVITRLQEQGGAHRDTAAVFEVLVDNATRAIPATASAEEMAAAMGRLARDLVALANDMRAAPEYADWLRGEYVRAIDRSPQSFDRTTVVANAIAILTGCTTPRAIESRDLFLVYLPEDRLPIAAPLAVELAKRRVSVAFSDYEVATKEQLTAALEHGLAHHGAGAILWSTAFERARWDFATSESNRLRIIRQPDLLSAVAALTALARRHGIRSSAK